MWQSQVHKPKRAGLSITSITLSAIKSEVVSGDERKRPVKMANDATQVVEVSIHRYDCGRQDGSEGARWDTVTANHTSGCGRRVTSLSTCRCFGRIKGDSGVHCTATWGDYCSEYSSPDYNPNVHEGLWGYGRVRGPVWLDHHRLSIQRRTAEVTGQRPILCMDCCTSCTVLQPQRVASPVAPRTDQCRSLL